MLHLSLGRNQEALGLFEEALAAREAQFGPGSLEVANVVRSIGDVRRRWSMRREAIAEYRRALAIQARAERPARPFRGGPGRAFSP